MQVSSYLSLGTIAIGQKLLLVVEQFLTSLGGEFLVLCWNKDVRDRPGERERPDGTNGTKGRCETECAETSDNDRLVNVLSTIASTGQAS